MARMAIGPATPERAPPDIEIARLRGLDVGALRIQWRAVFRRRAPPHLPRHLLFRILAYRLQADLFGDLGPDLQRLLERTQDSIKISELAASLDRGRKALKPGTLLAREWNGQMEHVMVVADGFSWRGKTYPSLSNVAFAITGTKWNGPRFFGLRDRSSKQGQVR